MSLLNRVGRLIRADLHGIMDCLEEPETLLRQAIREMEEEHERRSREAAKLEKKVQSLFESEEKQKTQLKKLEEEITLCLKAGDEQLAKTQIRRRIQSERALKDTLNSREITGRKLESVRKEVQELSTKMQSIKQRAEALSTSDQAEETDNGAVRNSAITDTEVEIELLQIKERLSGESRR